jgi:hypothetical protein
MKVWRIVVAEEPENGDSVKGTDSWHAHKVSGANDTFPASPEVEFDCIELPAASGSRLRLWQTGLGHDFGERPQRHPILLAGAL